MKILFTGASSFTGFWFARELLTSDHEVVATYTGTQDSYQGLKKQRLDLLAPHCQQVFSCPFGSKPFLDLITDHRDFSVFCHHGAQVSDYKSFLFPVGAAVAENTLNILPTIQSLQETSCLGMVLTGSVFEQNEGFGNTTSAISPYGLSKGLSSEIFRYYCDTLKFPLGKFVIPNPFGPLEEPRFINYLIHQWLADQVPQVKTPIYVRDNIHVSLLAKAYARFVQTLANQQRPLKHNPSGCIMNQGDFTLKIAEEMRPRLGKKCEVMLSKQEVFTEPTMRVNSEPVAHLFSEWHEATAFDALANYYLGRPYGI